MKASSSRGAGRNHSGRSSSGGSVGSHRTVIGPGGATALITLMGLVAACGGDEVELLPLDERELPALAQPCRDGEVPTQISFVCGLLELPQWYANNCSGILAELSGCTAGARAQNQAFCPTFGTLRQQSLGSWPAEGSGEVSSMLVRVEELRFGRPPGELFDLWSGYFELLGCQAQPLVTALDDVRYMLFECDGWVGYLEVRPESATVNGFWAGAASTGAADCIIAP